VPQNPDQFLYHLYHGYAELLDLCLQADQNLFTKVFRNPDHVLHSLYLLAQSFTYITHLVSLT